MSKYADSFRSLSALSGSVGKQGPVGPGYAYACKVLCDRADIPCIIVTSADPSVLYIWNYVKIDGLWYALDVAWNDPAVFDKNGTRIIKADSGYETEDYLLCGTDTKDSEGEAFSESHPVDSLKYTLPSHIKLSKTAYASAQDAQADTKDYAQAFYELLEESTDLDGIRDYLAGRRFL